MNDEVKPPPPAPPSLPRKTGRHVFVGAVLLALGCLSLTSLATAALAFRLSRGPMDAQFAVPAIEWALGSADVKFDIGALTLTWREGADPIVMDLRDMRVIGPRGEFMAIGQAELAVSPLHLLLARLHFKHAWINNLSVRLTRLPDGTITMTGAPSEEETQKESPTRALELDNIARALPAIERLSLTDTRVIFEDQREALIRRFEDVDVEINQSGSFAHRSVSGFLTTSLEGSGNESLAAVDFIYDGDERTLTAVARLENADTRDLIGGALRASNLPVIDMVVQGRAEMRLRNDLSLESMTLHLEGDDGMLYWPRSYGPGLENQKLTRFDLHVGFMPETQTLELLNAAVTLKGITVSANGRLAMTDNWNRLDGSLHLNIPVLAVDALPAVWPRVWDTGGREWLVDRMDKGRFSKIDVDIPLVAQRHLVPDEEAMALMTELGEEEIFDLEDEYVWSIATGTIKGTFGFTGVTVDYRAPLLPARNTTGTGVYEGLGLTLDIDSADIGALKVTEGRLYFDDLITPGKGNADLHFVMNGPVGAVFEYLEKEPISYRDKVDLDASRAQGRANVDVKITFPTLADMKVEDVHVAATAKLHDLVVPGAVKGMTLAGGPYDLEASENHFRLTGSGTIEGQPATISWHELFSPKPSDAFSSELEAELQTNKAVREKFIGALDARIDGIIPATVSLVTKPDGRGTLKVSADATGARIDFVNPFNAIKEKGVGASVRLTGTLQDGYIKSIDTLSASGPGITIASGNIGFARDAKNEPVLARALIKGLKLGENNVDIDAAWPSENSLRAIVTGNVFDARWVMGDEKPQDAASGQATPQAPLAYDVSIKVGRLYVADRPLDDVTGTFVGNTGGTITMASLDGTAAASPVTLRYGGTGGPGDRLLLELGDAGAGLAALGITERVRGGRLRAEGAPVQGGRPGDMQGTLVLEQFSVHKAPMLAKLVNLLSLPGLLSILNQDTGLRFERAEANITWLNRNGGATILFSDGRTRGASLGLTFEGEVNMATDTMAIQGTAIPMSEVNSLISSIPLVGDILTGGQRGSGIFAATYTMKGPNADPDVTINPLSVLAPGILRRILFEGALGGGSQAKPLTDSQTPSQ